MNRLYTLVILTIIISSCTPEKPDVECAGYPGNQLWEYFPYKVGDVLTFNDNKGNTHTIRIGDIHETEHKFLPYDKFLSEEDQQINCETTTRTVTSEGYYSGSEEGLSLKIEHFKQTLYGNSSQWEIWGHRMEDANNKFILSQSEGTRAYDSIVLNNKLYRDVISDSSYSSNPEKRAKSSNIIYFAKGVGLIGYTTYSSTPSSKDTTILWLSN